jgi:hypothetical protein
MVGSASDLSVEIVRGATGLPEVIPIATSA